MWLSKQISNACKLAKNVKIGKVTSTNSSSVTVQSDQEYRQINAMAPFGIISRPPIGTKVVITPVDNGYVCTGALSPGSSLEPGELMLYSKGGASIVLKNNGQVLINGNVIE